MIEKIYLDMDGVLCDFEKRFAELFGQSDEVIQSKKNDLPPLRNRKNFSTYWPIFIENEEFKTLEWHQGGRELLEFIKLYSDVKVEILSSSGGLKHHKLVKKQKKHWLKSKLINYKANIVPARKHKTEYATSKTILIDDTEQIIIDFNKAGGIGILHKNIDETLAKLKTLLASDTK